MSSVRLVTIYRKSACCLCDNARFFVQRLATRLGDVQIQEVDVSQDNALMDKYEDLIPVITVDGQVVSELKIDGPAIRRALENKTT